MRIRWTSFVFLLSLAVAAVTAQFGMPPGKQEAKPVKSDIQYIRCQVCELLAKNAYRQVKAQRDALKPGKKLLEADIMELVEKITNSNKEEGEWLAKLDLVETGSKLVVQEMDEVGKCGTECKIAQRAAESIVEYTDTDVAEKLWQGKQSRSQFSNWLCYEATSTCKSKPPPLPKDRKPGPAFEVGDPQEMQMAKMMDSMKEMGLGGQMYDRDTAMKKYMGGYEGTEDDYDEDEDEKSSVERIKLTKAEKEGDGALDRVAAAAKAAKESAAGVLGQATKAVSGLFGSKSDSASAEEIKVDL